MDYCECGQAATARCVECRLPLCDLHSDLHFRVTRPLEQYSGRAQAAILDEVRGRHLCKACVEGIATSIALEPEPAFTPDASAHWWSEVQSVESNFDQIPHSHLSETYEYLRNRLASLTAEQLAHHWFAIARDEIPWDGVVTEKLRGFMSDKPFEVGIWKFKFGGDGSQNTQPGAGALSLRDIDEYPPKIIQSTSVLAPTLERCADVVELTMQMALRVRDHTYPTRAYFVKLPNYVGSFAGPWPRFGSF